MGQWSFLLVPGFQMNLTITGRVNGTLNPERRMCGFSLWPEKTNFGDFRKFQEFPEVSLRISLFFLTFPQVSWMSLSFTGIVIMFSWKSWSYMLCILVFAIRRISLFISLNRAMNRRCSLYVIKYVDDR